MTTLFDLHQKLMQWASTLALMHVSGKEEEEEEEKKKKKNPAKLNS